MYVWDSACMGVCVRTRLCMRLYVCICMLNPYISISGNHFFACVSARVAYTCMCMCACVCVCVHVYASSKWHIYIYVCIYTNKCNRCQISQRDTYTCIYVYIYKYTGQLSQYTNFPRKKRGIRSKRRRSDVKEIHIYN